MEAYHNAKVDRLRRERETQQKKVDDLRKEEKTDLALQFKVMKQPKYDENRYRSFNEFFTSYLVYIKRSPFMS